MALAAAERKRLVQEDHHEKHRRQSPFLVNIEREDEIDMKNYRNPQQASPFRTEYFHHHESEVDHMNTWKETGDNDIDYEPKPSD